MRDGVNMERISKTRRHSALDKVLRGIWPILNRKAEATSNAVHVNVHRQDVSVNRVHKYALGHFERNTG